MSRFPYDSTSALDAHKAAQRLAFGPLLFEAVRVLRESGLLERARKAGTVGLTPDEATEGSGLSSYAVRLLLEAGLAAEVLVMAGERYRLTKTGLSVLQDRMVRANFDFVHDVCYLGAHRLEESLREGRPAGLAALGAEGSTVYDALKDLPERVRTSWFAFDHFYSDRAFPHVVPEVLARRPRHVLDVGGNTGRFALALLRADPDVFVTIGDLPGQLADARRALDAAGVGDRARFHAVDLLDASAPLPTGADVIWMSQLLSCFSLAQVTSILRRAREALSASSRLFVLETFWDRQHGPVAPFCLQATSVYFACIANGVSKMHRAADLLPCLDEAGLVLETSMDGIGAAHSLWVCRRTDAPIAAEGASTSPER